MILAREKLAGILSFISSGRSFWYTINGSTSSSLSLARRLGFFSKIEYYAFLVAANLAEYTQQKDGSKKLVILKDEWAAFLSADLGVEKAEYGVLKFDLDAAIRGEKQQQNCHLYYHTIRIGRRYDSYPKSIGKQKAASKLITTPPHLPGLRSQQRVFSRGRQALICRDHHQTRGPI